VPWLRTRGDEGKEDIWRWCSKVTIDLEIVED